MRLHSGRKPPAAGIHPHKTNNAMKKKPKLLIIFLCIFCGVFCVMLLCGMRTLVTQDAAEYTANSGIMQYPLPAGASDCRFALRKSPLARRYFSRFVLSEPDAQAYIDALVAEYHLDSQDENDRQYGCAHWYQMPVSECHGGCEPDDFPVHMPFDLVTGQDVKNAVILVYVPQETGSRCSGIIYFPESCEFISFLSVTH